MIEGQIYKGDFIWYGHELFYVEEIFVRDGRIFALLGAKDRREEVQYSALRTSGQVAVSKNKLEEILTLKKLYERR